MSLVQLLMTPGGHATPFIALFCKAESVSMPKYYEARQIATRLSTCNEPNRATGQAPEDDRGYLR